MGKLLYRALAVIVAFSLTLSMAGPVLADEVPTDQNAGNVIARIWTDKDDYSPGETVIICGEGFEPSSRVSLVVVRPDGTINDPVYGIIGEWEVAADEYGAFETAYQLDGIEGTYHVTAMDPSGRSAQTTFTDAPKVGSVAVGAQSPNPVTAGGSATYTVTVNRGSGSGSSGSFTADLSITTSLPAGVTYSFSPNPVGFEPGDSSKTSTLTITTTSATPAGTTTFTVKAATSDKHYAEGNGTLSVIRANTPPVAYNQSVTTPEDTPVAITLTATDADGDPLTYFIVSGPSHGSLSGTPPNVTYTPVADYNGSDSFTFKANDGQADSNIATVSITVNPVNDAPVAVDDSYSVDEDNTLTVAAPGVLGNDTDVEGDTLTAILVSDVSYGTLTLNPDGSFSYTPNANWYGTDSFTYKANDGSLDSNIATVTITVNPVNDAPVAYDQSVTTDEDTPIAITLTATDADGDPLTYSIVSGPSHGSLSGTPPNVTYTPAADYNGSDSFTFKANDGQADSNIATVTITVNSVNDAPVAQDDSYSVDEDNTLDVSAPGVLGNDTDVEGDTLTAILVSDVSYGTLTLNPDGSFSYTPNANWCGTDSFTYKANDGSLDSNIATVSITVNSVNDAPVLDPIGNKTVDEQTLLTFVATATDVDSGDTLTFSLIDAPAGASIDPSTGAFSWTPTEAQGPGSYTFKIRVTDDGSPNLYDEEEITVTVNETNKPPVLDSIGDKTVDEETLLTFTATASDPDIPANTLTFSLIDAPAGASIDPSTGAFSWTPTEAQGPGSYTFKVRVTDDGSPNLYDEEEITVTVNETNKPPVLDSIGDKTVDEETLLTFTATASDPDIPANTLTFSLIDAPAGASIDPSTGAFSWTPTEAQGPGSYTFKIRVTDDGSPNLYDEEEITVTVNETNKPPVLDPIGNKTADEETLLTFTATASDLDIPANTLTFSLIGAPEGASIDPSTGAFSWTPTEAQGPGSYTFKVRVTDDGSPNLYDEEEITVTVNETNKPPVLDPIGDRSLPWGDTLTFTATASDPDLPANTLTFSLVDAPAGASIDGSTGKFTWTPTSGQIGSHTFTVKVCDDGTPSLCDEEEITVTVGKRATTLVYGGDSSGQYSDQVTLSATLTDSVTGDPIPDRSVGFQLGSQSASGNTNHFGVAQAFITLNQPAASYTVNSEFAGDDLYLPSSDSDPFTISKETAKITYTGDTFVYTAGPSISTAPVRLAANLIQDDDGYPGDITLARVRFELFKSGNLGTTPDKVVGNVPVDASGNALVIESLAVDLWTVFVKIEPANGYWTASQVGMDTIAVDYGSTTRRVTGGGWIPDSQSVNGKGNFGFTVNYQKTGTPKGNSIYLFRGSDGYNYLVKSNSWQGGGLSFLGTYKASFSGKCVVQKIDRATGLVVESWGNYRFTVDIWDGDLQSPKTFDRYAITILRSDGTIWRQIGTSASPIQLGGGNLAIHNK